MMPNPTVPPPPQSTTVSVDDLRECKELRDHVSALQLQLNDMQNKLLRSDEDKTHIASRVAELEAKVDVYKSLMLKVGDMHELERPYDHASFMSKLIPSFEAYDRPFKDKISELECEVATLRSAQHAPTSLHAENKSLKRKLSDYETRMGQLKAETKKWKMLACADGQVPVSRVLLRQLLHVVHPDKAGDRGHQVTCELTRILNAARR